MGGSRLQGRAVYTMRPRPASRCAALLLLLAAAAVIDAFPQDDPETNQVLKPLYEHDADEKLSNAALATVFQWTADHPPMQVPIACLHKNFMMESTNLTLDVIAKIAASPSCQRDVAEGDKLLSRLQHRLATLQHGTTCREHAMSTTEVFNTGFGGTMHGLVKPLMYTFVHNLTMLSLAMPGWTGSECGWTMACFFQTLAPACEGTDPFRLREHRKEHEHKIKSKIKVWGTAFTGEDEYADEKFAQQLKNVQRASPETHNFVNQNMVRMDDAQRAGVRRMGAASGPPAPTLSLAAMSLATLHVLPLLLTTECLPILPFLFPRSAVVPVARRLCDTSRYSTHGLVSLHDAAAAVPLATKQSASSQARRRDEGDRPRGCARKRKCHRHACAPRRRMRRQPAVPWKGVHDIERLHEVCG